jgi:hypothetical protein
MAAGTDRLSALWHDRRRNYVLADVVPMSKLSSDIKINWEKRYEQLLRRTKKLELKYRKLQAEYIKLKAEKDLEPSRWRRFVPW